MIRLAVRGLLKRPGTSALAVLALALGIGLTTTMFSIVDGVFLRGLPFEDADRILYVGSTARTAAGPLRPGGFKTPDFLDVRAAQRSFEELAAFSQNVGQADLIGPDGVPLRYEAALLTPNALRVLRVSPLVGRGFDDADAVLNAPRVLLIGETVWRAQFQSDPQIAGRVIRANGQPATIIGVLPAFFGFPESEKVWMPLTADAGLSRAAPGSLRFEAFGRLRDGVSVKDANVELTAIAARLENQFPENKDRGAAAMPYIQRRVPRRTALTFSTMLVAVFGVLLIACVNVANLQLARAAERTREVAIRLALGATRARVVRQLLLEGLCLAAAGAIGGLLLARIGTALVTRGLDGTGVPFWVVFAIDARVLIFATALTAFAAVASSLMPALRVTRTAPNDVLKDEGRAATSLRIGRFSRTLVTAQIALSFGLLIASGLVIKSIVNTSLTSVPFRTDLLAARLSLGTAGYMESEAVRQVLERVYERVSAIPGVSAVTFANDVPGFSMAPIEIEDQPLPADPLPQPNAEILLAGPDYFRVMSLPVVSGRPFGAGDRNGSEPVAIVSQDFVGRYFPGQEAIGRRFRIGRNEKTPQPWRMIVGIVPAFGNLTSSSRDHNATALVPFDQIPSRAVDVVVASAGDPLAPAYAVRQAVASVDQRIAVDRVATVKGRYDARVSPFRVFGGLFSAFGVAALLLASAGLYGVMAFAVRRRTAEIGIRMALGADRRRILKMVLWQGAVMLGVGIVLGAGLGFGLGAQLGQLLLDVSTWDTPVFLTALGVLMLSGLAALLVPARRAAGVDPLVALRQD